MTMAVVDAVTLEESGFSIQEVEPGSADDPFTVLNQRPSPNPGMASPARSGLIGGVQMVQSEDGTQVQPRVLVSTQPPASAPVAPVTPAAPTTPATPEPELSPMQKAVQDGSLDTYVAGLVKDQIGTILRSQQGSYDKRITTLTDELKAAREAALVTAREGKLENLTDDEQQILREKWAIEDERRMLDAEIEVADTYFRSMYVATLIQDYAQFGVTAEDLEQLDEPEEMDAFVAEKELSYYRSGQHLTAVVPAHQVESSAVQPVETAPAGAQAPTDVGGSGPSTTPAKFDESPGLDVMARNLNNLPWQSLPMPN